MWQKLQEVKEIKIDNLFFEPSTGINRTRVLKIEIGGKPIIFYLLIRQVKLVKE